MPPASSDLVLYYTLNETSGYFNDLSAANNDGAPNGPLTYGPGQVASAIGFDGNAAFIDAGTSSSLAPAAITVSAWVKPSSFSGNGNGQRTLIERRQYGGANSYQVALTPSGSATPGHVFFSRWSGASEIGAGSTSVLALNTWTHVAATYDGAMIHIFVNGIREDSQAASGAINADNLKTIIGAGNQGSANFYAGILDEVRIYAKALSAQQVADLYELGNRPECHGILQTNNPSATPTPIPSASPTPTASASPTASATPNPSPSASPTISASPTASATPAATPSATPPPTGIFIPDKKCSTNLHFNFIRASGGMRCWEGKVQYNTGSASWLLPFSSHKVKVNGGSYGVDDGCERIIVNGVTVVDRFGPCAQASGNMCLYAHGGSFGNQVEVIGPAVTMDIRYVDAFACTCKQGNLWVESTVTYEAPQCAEQPGYTING